jgi:hypothetical protein
VEDLKIVMAPELTQDKAAGALPSHSSTIVWPNAREGCRNAKAAASGQAEYTVVVPIGGGASFI